MDRFNNDVELPEATTPASPDAGYVSVYGKNGTLATLDSSGREKLLEDWQRQTSDFTTTSTSFVDVTGQTFAVAANKHYKFEFHLAFSTSSAISGVGFAINGPANPVLFVSDYLIFNSLSAPITVMSRTYDVGGQTLAQDAANVPIVAKVTGLLSTGATAGTLALRFRGESALATYKVLIGSIGRVVEL